MEANQRPHINWSRSPTKNCEIHIDVSHSRQPLVKGERLVRYEVNTVMLEDSTRKVPSKTPMPRIMLSSMAGLATQFALHDDGSTVVVPKKRSN